jgi:hypothetical protein
VKVLR